jgi:hypothetical protein
MEAQGYQSEGVADSKDNCSTFWQKAGVVGLERSER